MKQYVVEMTKIINPTECMILGVEKVNQIYDAMLNKQEMSLLHESELLHRFNEPIELIQCVEMTLSIIASVLTIINHLRDSKSDDEKATLFENALSLSLKLDDYQKKAIIKILKKLLDEKCK